MTDIFIKVPNGRHFRQDGLEKGSRPQERSKRLAPPERKERKARGCGDRGRHGNFQSTSFEGSLGTHPLEHVSLKHFFGNPEVAATLEDAIRRKRIPQTL